MNCVVIDWYCDYSRQCRTYWGDWDQKQHYVYMDMKTSTCEYPNGSIHTTTASMCACE